MRKHKSAIEIGERIKKIRINLNLQQKEMAKTLQIAASYLCGIENGSGNPGPELFARLATEYHVNMNYLFTGKGEMFGDAPIKIKKETLNINGEIDCIEKLNWMLDKSLYLRNAVLNYSNKVLFLEKDVIKYGMQVKESKSKKKKNGEKK